MLINKQKSLSKADGFTLVEIAVVAPIVVLVITGVLVVLINFISSNAITSSRLNLTNDTHSALNDMASNLTSAQSFASSVDSGLSLQNLNSTDYSSQPKLIAITTDEVGTGSSAAPALKDCSQPASADNLRPTATIYYLDSSNNLKRRILTQSTTPCGGTSVNPKNCRAFNTTSSCANDTILATNITSFTIKYCIDGSCATSNAPSDADSVDISLAAQKVVAGQTLNANNKIHIGILAKAPDHEDAGSGGTGTTCPSGSTGYTDQSVTGTATGSVWGTDIYTNDSTVGKAAVHAGLVSVGQTATIRVCALPGQSSYTGSTRNGVTTSNWGSFGGSIALLLLPSCPSGTTSYTDQSVTGTASGSVWGTDIYTNDSTVGKAAVHVGLISIGQTATIRVCALPGQSSYTGSTRNGITTSNWTSFGGSIALILAPS